MITFLTIIISTGQSFYDGSFSIIYKGVARGVSGAPLIPLLWAFFKLITCNRWWKCHDNLVSTLTSTHSDPSLKPPGYTSIAEHHTGTIWALHSLFWVDVTVLSLYFQELGMTSSQKSPHTKQDISISQVEICLRVSSCFNFIKSLPANTYQ